MPKKHSFPRSRMVFAYSEVVVGTPAKVHPKIAGRPGKRPRIAVPAPGDVGSDSSIFQRIRISMSAIATHLAV
jgi:hypothetical protein